MSKEAMKLALEALEIEQVAVTMFQLVPKPHITKAITAIKQARALDKMADNARELGLDYEPAPVQEPVAMRHSFDGYGYKYTDMSFGGGWKEWTLKQHPDAEPVYAHSAAQPAPVQEPHSWYSAEHDEWMTNKTRKEHEALNSYTHKVGGFDLALYTTPPAAQRQWVGLTDEEVGDLSDFAYANDEEFVRNVEAKLKEKNA